MVGDRIEFEVPMRVQQVRARTVTRATGRAPREARNDRHRAALQQALDLAGAAERLGVNHSTAFRRLGQLEKALGTKLFERHRTGYALTAAGEVYARYAQAVTLESERMRSDLEELRGLRRGVILALCIRRDVWDAFIASRSGVK